MHPVGRLGIRLKFKEKVGFWINSNAIIVPPLPLFHRPALQRQVPDSRRSNAGPSASAGR